MSGGAAKTRRVKRDIDFAAPPVLVYRPKGSLGEGLCQFRGSCDTIIQHSCGFAAEMCRAADVAPLSSVLLMYGRRIAI